eukprot:gene25916-11592_t
MQTAGVSVRVGTSDPGPKFPRIAIAQTLRGAVAKPPRIPFPRTAKDLLHGTEFTDPGVYASGTELTLTITTQLLSHHPVPPVRLVHPFPPAQPALLPPVPPGPAVSPSFPSEWTKFPEEADFQTLLTLPPGSTASVLYRAVDSASQSAYALRVLTISCVYGLVACQAPPGGDAPACVDAAICSASDVASAMCDRGATAQDELDGDLTNYAKACVDGSVDKEAVRLRDVSYLSVGLSMCGIDTRQPGTYHVIFSVSNSRGVSASRVVRNVVVGSACSFGTQASLAGCDVMESEPLSAEALLDRLSAPPAALQPKITLIETASLGTVVQIKKGAEFAKCVEGSIDPAPCVLGATAMSWDGRDLSYKVLACPPEDCWLRGCKGYEYAKVGLAPCDLSTAMAKAEVGETLRMRFVVYGDAWPPEAESVERLLVVVGGCRELEMYLCNGVCSEVSCAVRSLLPLTKIIPPTTMPPTILLLYKEVLENMGAPWPKRYGRIFVPLDSPTSAQASTSNGAASRHLQYLSTGQAQAASRHLQDLSTGLAQAASRHLQDLSTGQAQAASRTLHDLSIGLGLGSGAHLGDLSTGQAQAASRQRQDLRIGQGSGPGAYIADFSSGKGSGLGDHLGDLSTGQAQAATRQRQDLRIGQGSGPGAYIQDLKLGQDSGPGASIEDLRIGQGSGPGANIGDIFIGQGSGSRAELQELSTGEEQAPPRHRQDLSIGQGSGPNAHLQGISTMRSPGPRALGRRLLQGRGTVGYPQGLVTELDGTTIYAAYGQPLPVALSRCTSSELQPAGTCGVSAADSDGEDISASVMAPAVKAFVNPLSPIDPDTVIPSCDPLSVGKGTCLPGIYNLSFAVWDKDMRKASMSQLAVVEGRIEVELWVQVSRACDNSNGPAGGGAGSGAASVPSLQQLQDSLPSDQSFLEGLVFGVLPKLGLDSLSVRWGQLEAVSVESVPADTTVCLVNASLVLEMGCVPLISISSDTVIEHCPCPVLSVATPIPAAPSSGGKPTRVSVASPCKSTTPQVNLFLDSLKNSIGMLDDYAEQFADLLAYQRQVAAAVSEESRQEMLVCMQLGASCEGSDKQFSFSFLGDQLGGGIPTSFTAALTSLLQGDSEASSCRQQRLPQARFVFTVGSPEGSASIPKSSNLGGLLAKDIPPRRVVGVTNNQIIGGLFLHQTRRSMGSSADFASDPWGSCSGSSQFAKAYTTACQLEVPAKGDGLEEGMVRGRGVGPTMQPKSSIFYKGAYNQPEAWYNTTAPNPHVSDKGTVWGFETGLPDGFPFAMTVSVKEGRLKQMMAYLKDGRYLDTRDTSSLKAQVATFNPELRAYGLFKAVWTWGTNGAITARFDVVDLAYHSFKFEANSKPAFVCDSLLMLATAAFSMLWLLEASPLLAIWWKLAMLNLMPVPRTARNSGGRNASATTSGDRESKGQALSGLGNRPPHKTNALDPLKDAGTKGIGTEGRTSIRDSGTKGSTKGSTSIRDSGTKGSSAHATCMDMTEGSCPVVSFPVDAPSHLMAPCQLMTPPPQTSPAHLHHPHGKIIHVVKDAQPRSSSTRSMEAVTEGVESDVILPFSGSLGRQGSAASRRHGVAEGVESDVILPFSRSLGRQGSAASSGHTVADGGESEAKPRGSTRSLFGMMSSGRQISVATHEHTVADGGESEAKPRGSTRSLFGMMSSGRQISVATHEHTVADGGESEAKPRGSTRSLFGMMSSGRQISVATHEHTVADGGESEAKPSGLSHSLLGMMSHGRQASVASLKHQDVHIRLYDKGRPGGLAQTLDAMKRNTSDGSKLSHTNPSQAEVKQSTKPSQGKPKSSSQPTKPSQAKPKTSRSKLSHTNPSQAEGSPLSRDKALSTSESEPDDTVKTIRLSQTLEDMTREFSDPRSKLSPSNASQEASSLQIRDKALSTLESEPDDTVKTIRLSETLDDMTRKLSDPRSKLSPSNASQEASSLQIRDKALTTSESEPDDTVKTIRLSETLDDMTREFSNPRSKLSPSNASQEASSLQSRDKALSTLESEPDDTVKTIRLSQTLEDITRELSNPRSKLSPSNASQGASSPHSRDTSFSIASQGEGSHLNRGKALSDPKQGAGSPHSRDKALSDPNQGQGSHLNRDKDLTYSEGEPEFSPNLLVEGSKVVWFIYDACIVLFMAAALATLLLYHANFNSENLPREGTFDVYDADQHAPSHYLMLKRKLIYTLLQSIILLLMLIRIISLLVFYPTLAIIPFTLIQACPDLLHLAIALMVVVVMYAMLLTTCMGASVEVFSDLDKSMYLTTSSIVVGGALDLFQGCYHYLQQTSSTAAMFTVPPVAYAGSLFLIVIANSFILAILSMVFKVLKAVAMAQTVARLEGRGLAHQGRGEPTEPTLGSLAYFGSKAQLLRTLSTKLLDQSPGHSLPRIYTSLASKLSAQSSALSVSCKHISMSFQKSIEARMVTSGVAGSDPAQPPESKGSSKPTATDNSRQPTGDLAAQGGDALPTSLRTVGRRLPRRGYSSLGQLMPDAVSTSLGTHQRGSSTQQYLGMMDDELPVQFLNYSPKSSMAARSPRGQATPAHLSDNFDLATRNSTARGFSMPGSPRISRMQACSLNNSSALSKLDQGMCQHVSNLDQGMCQPASNLDQGLVQAAPWRTSSHASPRLTSPPSEVSLDPPQDLMIDVQALDPGNRRPNRTARTSHRPRTPVLPLPDGRWQTKAARTDQRPRTHILAGMPTRTLPELPGTHTRHAHARTARATRNSRRMSKLSDITQDKEYKELFLELPNSAHAPVRGARTARAARNARRISQLTDITQVKDYKDFLELPNSAHAPATGARTARGTRNARRMSQLTDITQVRDYKYFLELPNSARAPTPVGWVSRRTSSRGRLTICSDNSGGR